MSYLKYSKALEESQESLNKIKRLDEYQHEYLQHCIKFLFETYPKFKINEEVFVKGLHCLRGHYQYHANVLLEKHGKIVDIGLTDKGNFQYWVQYTYSYSFSPEKEEKSIFFFYDEDLTNER